MTIDNKEEKTITKQEILDWFDQMEKVYQNAETKSALKITRLLMFAPVFNKNTLFKDNIEVI